MVSNSGRKTDEACLCLGAGDRIAGLQQRRLHRGRRRGRRGDRFVDGRGHEHPQTPDRRPIPGPHPIRGRRPTEGRRADGGDAAADSGAALDASDGACPSSWFEAPEVDPSISVPDGGGGVLLHAGGNGTQNYICAATTTDAGTTYAWILVTPDATLSDCHETVIGHHFASEAGAGFPEWQTLDGTYVVGQKHLPAFTPDGGSGSIPWLLLHAVDAGGAGTLSQTQYIQRLNTDGGNAPADVCNAGSVGTAKNVPYTADYFFFGP